MFFAAHQGLEGAAVVDAMAQNSKEVAAAQHLLTSLSAAPSPLHAFWIDDYKFAIMSTKLFTSAAPSTCEVCATAVGAVAAEVAT